MSGMQTQTLPKTVKEVMNEARDDTEAVAAWAKWLNLPVSESWYKNAVAIAKYYSEKHYACSWPGACVTRL